MRKIYGVSISYDFLAMQRNDVIFTHRHIKGKKSISALFQIVRDMINPKKGRTKWPEVLAQKLVNPNDILTEKITANPDSTFFKGLLPDWCMPETKTNGGKDTPNFYKSPVFKTSNKNTSGCEYYWMEPVYTTHRDPFLLRTARDYLHRLAFTSYVQRKKTPLKKCSICSQHDTPSGIVPMDVENDWSLPFANISLPHSDQRSRSNGTLQNLSGLTNCEISPVSSIMDTADVSDMNDLINVRSAITEPADVTRFRRESQEVLIRHALMEDLIEFVCLPFAESKHENSYHKMKGKHGLYQSQGMDTSSPSKCLPGKQSPSCPSSSPRRRSSYLQRRRRCSSDSKRHLQSELDVSIQNTVNFCVNMSSPIKSDEDMTMSPVIGARKTRRCLLYEMNDAIMQEAKRRRNNNKQTTTVTYETVCTPCSSGAADNLVSVTQTNTQDDYDYEVLGDRDYRYNVIKRSYDRDI